MPHNECGKAQMRGRSLQAKKKKSQPAKTKSAIAHIVFSASPHKSHPPPSDNYNTHLVIYRKYLITLAALLNNSNIF